MSEHMDTGSDEYRRVLHEWARTQLATLIGDPLRVARVTDVKFDYDAARAWSSVTFEDAYFATTIEWIDTAGARQRQYVTGNPEDGAKSLGVLLSELFKIADRSDAGGAQ